MAASASRQIVDLQEPPSWRRTKSRIATVLMVVAFLLAIIPLVFVLYTVIAKGASIISWQFLTGSIPPNVLPAAIGGIVSGALLAVARAAGETAPLLFTILTVTTANPNVFSGANTAIPSQIFANATSPYPGAQGRAWGAALTLIVIAFALMVAARFITARFTRYSR